MATFNFDLVGSSFQRNDPAFADRLFSIDGYQMYPPPEDVKYDNNYRITVKQTAAGQFADKGGVGGVEINVAGKVEWKKAAWLRALRERFADNSSEAEFMVWFDPVDQLSYEVIVQSDSIQSNVLEHGFHHYRIKMWGQVLGGEWANLTPVEATTGKVAEFDLASLGWIAEDVTLATMAYEEAIKGQADAVATSSGNEQPTSLEEAMSILPEELTSDPTEPYTPPEPYDPLGVSPHEDLGSSGQFYD